jgi:DNA-binding NarL/FixJ family response regulator
MGSVGLRWGGLRMGGSIVHILVVDDFHPWRRFVSSILQEQPHLQIVGEASDGLEAVQKARELQPDLILLDIGLPTMNGIEAARRIRGLSPNSKILFLSENRSLEIVEEALRTGAGGFIVKSDATGALLSAVEAVFKGKLFLSTSVAGTDVADLKNQHSYDHIRARGVLRFPSQNMPIARRHEVGFYSHDRHLLDDVTQFVGGTLRVGNAVIVVATESHRHHLLSRLQANGIDIGAAVEEGRYLAWDAAGALSAFMVNGMPDRVRFLKLIGGLIATAVEAAKGGQSRVALFGEGVDLLWAQGNAEAAIRVERLTNQLAKNHAVDILCGYGLNGAEGGMDKQLFQQISAEHSAVHSR